MRAAHRTLLGATIWLTLGLTGCGSTGGFSETSFLYKNFTIADGSAMAGEGHTVLFKGAPCPSQEPASKSASPSER